MALPMNKKEHENWTETRKQGSTKYAAKTAFFATIATFLIYLITNGFINLADIDKYIAYNIAQAELLAVTLLITFAFLFVAAKILFGVNEKRYSSTNLNNG